jgi:uncharacterized protein (DUF58 family)
MKLTSLGRSTAILGLAGLIVGVVLRAPVLVGLGVAILGLVGTSMLTVAEPPDIAVRRSLSPSEVERGRPAEVVLDFEPRARARLRPFLAIETVAGERRVAAVPAIPTGQIHRVTYQMTTNRRGNFLAGPLSLRRVDLFGLVVAERKIAGTDNLSVRPRRYRLASLPTGRRRDLEGPTRESSAGSASFHQLREYVPGDDLRLIHWRSTAKTGELVVKQMVDTTRPEMLVILDNRKIAIEPDDFEDAVEIAASLIQAAKDAGFPYQLLSSDGDNELTPDGHEIGFLDRLTVVELSVNNSLLELTDAIRARGRSLVFITGELHSGDMSLVARLARGFSPAVIISVVSGRRGPFVAPPGVRALACSSVNDFVLQWRGNIV